MYFRRNNRRLFSIEFQLHTNSHVTLWLPVLTGSDLVLKLPKKTGPLFSKYGQNDLVNIYKLQYHDSQFLSIAFEFR